MGIVEIVCGKRDLLELVGALHASCGFAGGLDGGQEECDEHADDGNDDEEFDEGEASFASGSERFVFH